MKLTSKFYISEDTNILYIEECSSEGKTWGWWKYYDKQFRMCMPREKAKTFKQLTKEEFDKLYFLEKL